jgi:hypothetical protein
MLTQYRVAWALMADGRMCNDGNDSTYHRRVRRRCQDRRRCPHEAPGRSDPERVEYRRHELGRSRLFERYSPVVQ